VLRGVRVSRRRRIDENSKTPRSLSTTLRARARRLEPQALDGESHVRRRPPRLRVR
jgi:hypothetical protein